MRVYLISITSMRTFFWPSRHEPPPEQVEDEEENKEALKGGERSIQAVLKDDLGRIVRESRVEKDEQRILEFLDGTGASVAMESGYNH